jgi:hypothetical protein
MNYHKKLTDEEIQQLMDTKIPSEKPDLPYLEGDAEMYKVLMEYLDKEPSIHIPEGFAEKTTHIAHKRKEIRDMMRNVVLILSVSIPIIAISLSAVYFMGEGIFWEFINLINSGSKYILFGAIGIVTIQILDKVLIQDKLKEIQNS